MSVKQSASGYFPMMITSKVQPDESVECADVPLCNEVDLARKQAMHLAIKQNLKHMLRKSVTYS